MRRGPESARWPTESLRKMRAVHALELAATADARRLLEGLAAGAPDAWLTRDAQHAQEVMDALRDRGYPPRVV